MFNIKYQKPEEARTLNFLKSDFLKNFRVGVEIEGNVEEEEEMECEMLPSECGACDECYVCERCESYGVYCGNCNHYLTNGENVGRCTHREDNGHCNHYDDDICDMCQSEEVRCNGCDPCDGCDNRHNTTDIDIVHSNISADLNCSNSHIDYDPNCEKFQCVYNDGSVNTEIVTSALKPKDFKSVLNEGINALLDVDAKISPYEKAGFHQTFSFDRPFPVIICKNIFQLVRYYLPALLCISCIDGTYQRNNGTDFRAIPESGLRIGENIFNAKYSAVHIKEINSLPSLPSLMEFRYADVTKNINQVCLTMLFNAAIILKAFEESEKGIIEMQQLHFNLVKQNVKSIYDTGDYFDYAWVKDLVFEMFKYLKPELSKITDTENVYHHLIDITNHHHGHMDNEDDLSEVKIK